MTRGAVAVFAPPPKDADPDDAIMGVDGPALDAANLSALAGAWAHAIACYAGVELAAQACHRGAECFVGYDVALRVEWHPDDIPEAIRPRFIELVTCTTLALAEGVREGRALRRRANQVAEAIEEWCIDHPEQADGIEATARQLVDRLVYRPSSEPPP